MRRGLALLVVLLVPLGIAACGGGSKKSSSTSSSTSSTSTVGAVTIPGPVEARPAPAQRPAAAAIAQRCPAGRSDMGCAESASPNLTRGRQLAIPNVPLFPDVSEFQGTVGWDSVASWQRSHGWHPLAVWKMGEFRIDHFARRNASETKRLGFSRAGYWFLRNTGCAHEAQQIVDEARAEGLRAVVEDDEVPEARGYAACLTPRLHAAGLTVIEYSAPGTNPDGGSNPGVAALWVAAYGPQHVPCLFTCTVGDLSRQSIVAWQLTDGVFGFVTNVPGVGRDDVSADYGMGKVLAGGSKPAPAPAPRPPASSFAVFPTSVKHGHWSERQLAESLDGALANRAKFAGYIKGTLNPEALWFIRRLDRLAFVLNPRPHPNWTPSHDGVRHLLLSRLYAGQRIGGK